MSPLMSKIVERLSDNRLVFFSLVVTTILTLIINRIDSVLSGESGVGMVYLQLAFTRHNFEGVLASWGINGIRYYIEHLWVLFLFPPAYAVLLTSAQVYTRAKREDLGDITGSEKIKLFVPVAAAFFDLSEKILHSIILTMRFYAEWIIFISSVSAVLKWFFLGFSVIIILSNFIRGRKTRGSI